MATGALQRHALSLDPGQSTGAVLADWPDRLPLDWSQVVWSGATIGHGFLQGWLIERATRFVYECRHRSEPCLVVVERPPQNAREPGGAARLIEEWLGDVGCLVTARWVSPGEWKPWVKANPLPKSLGKPGTVHEKDALSLVYYTLETERKRR